MWRRAAVLLAAVPAVALAQATQPIDQAYTQKIKEYLQDPRITTELVDYLPASSTVPTPLAFLGRIIGTPGELTYAKDINRYFEALDKASDRVKVWNIGRTEEGRDMIVFAVADEQTIRDLDRYKGMLAALTDPRKTSADEAKRIIGQAKPIYWLTSGMHSPETGGPEMLMELAYRLAVDESPFVKNIRDNVITFITPVVEVDGREKQVDTYYFNKKLPAGSTRLPLMYWGKYVAHDNNRDGMGQFLALTRNINRFFLEWHPPIMHDLHESVSYLYVSTGTGPYNEALDPITVDEWWMLAKSDVMEMTKRGVPGVWTYGFYDGWTPNYMFSIAHTHNATGRFYEVQSYGPDTSTVRLPATTTSREWFRPNPPLASIKWGPRNNTNIQESGVLFALSHVAKNRELYLENYWLKNVRSVDRGRKGPTYAWVIPASQRRKADAAEAINALRDQGLEVHRATSAFKAGSVDVKAGDYVVRADQPYRTLADMYFSIQNFSPSNPRPYDDTGWTFQLMRDITITPVSDSGILKQQMVALAEPARAAGGVTGSGPVLVVEHTADNNLMKFRYRFPTVKMSAAEDDFEAAGHRFRAGAIVIANADRAKLEPALAELGLSGYAMASAPSVATHDLDVPRIGYVHSWQRTQDEGWVRAALDTYGVPYTYFADQKLRDGNLRAKYDVIVLPHIGGTAESQVNGIAKTSATPLPYRRTAATPNLGALDQSDDIRGGMGVEGLMKLYEFVQQGGTLIVEGSTTNIFPDYHLTPGVSVEDPPQLFARGTILRGIIADTKSPIVYGYEGTQLPVYFNQAPVLRVAAAGANAFAFGGGGGGAAQQGGPSQNITPQATQLKLSTWTGASAGLATRDSGLVGRRGGAQRGGAARGADSSATQRQAQQSTQPRPRVVMQFPESADDMLLSGTLAGGQALSGRAQVVDEPLGKGHVVMFAIRPFWRWQTQGTYMLGFNAILNWNDLDAGKSGPAAPTQATMAGEPRPQAP